MSKSNYYEDLNDILLVKWWKCCEGDLTHTRKNIELGTKKKDWEAWCKIHDSYLSEFVNNKEATDRVHEIRHRIALLECDLVIEDNTFLRNEIRKLNVELFDIIKRSMETGLDQEGLMIQLEKWIGFRLNENEITARKYFNIIKQFEREMEAMSKG